MHPIFVKGNLKFSMDQEQLEFTHQNISIHGLTGLPWGALNPNDHLGKEAKGQVEIPSTPPITFEVELSILSEETLHSQSMGLRFHLNDAMKKTLSEYIEKYGFFPTEYIRKYPRMPSLRMIQTFPVLAITSFLNGGNRKETCTFEVNNLSPNGVLLTTENPFARSISPGARLEICLEPRGWFPIPVKMEGVVCRITDEVLPQSGNILRYFGVKFSKFDEVNRLTFIDLLKDILKDFSKQPEGSLKAMKAPL